MPPAPLPAATGRRAGAGGAAYGGTRVGLTLVAVDFGEEIKHLRATMDSVREVTNLDALTAQIQRL